jgi:hypothetical protein
MLIQTAVRLCELSAVCVVTLSVGIFKTPARIAGIGHEGISSSKSFCFQNDCGPRSHVPVSRSTRSFTYIHNQNHIVSIKGIPILRRKFLPCAASPHALMVDAQLRWSAAWGLRCPSGNTDTVQVSAQPHHPPWHHPRTRSLCQQRNESCQLPRTVPPPTGGFRVIQPHTHPCASSLLPGS